MKKKHIKKLKGDIKSELLNELKGDGFIEKEKVLNYLDELIEAKTTPTKLQKYLAYIRYVVIIYIVFKLTHLMFMGEQIDQVLLMEGMKIVLGI